MMFDLPFDVVELVPWSPPAAPPGSPKLREVAFRQDVWLPDEIDHLRTRFRADDDLQEIADGLDRPLCGVRSKIADLGLRRNSSRPWTEMDDAYVVQNYGIEATSTAAAALGRSAAAIYARAGFLGLTEGNAPTYTEWELVQIRAGYAQGVQVAQLAVLIGRPVCGIASIASTLGIRHANAPPDWSEAEQQRALEMAEDGRRYRQIALDLSAEGFPDRQHGAIGQVLRKLGYGRGWGVPGWPKRTT